MTQLNPMIFWKAFSTEPHATLYNLLRHDPVHLLPGLAVVCRRDDVLHILEHDDIFAVPYGKKMAPPRGPFILGMQDSPQYRQERSIAWGVLPTRQEYPAIEQGIQAATRASFEQAGSSLDLIQDVIWPVLIDTMRRFFGFGCAVPTKDIQRWFRAIHRDLLRNQLNNQAWIKEADEAFAAMHLHITQGTPPPGTVWERLTQTELDADGVRRNLIGLAIGVVETTMKTVTRAVDQFFLRPEVLMEARTALIQDEMDRFMALLWECLRFNPQNHVLFRLSLRAETLPSGTTIPADTLVLASVLTAMHDPRQIDEPEVFRPGREPSTYLIFGHGLHKCAGMMLAPVIIRGLLSTLLLVPGLRPSAETPFDAVDSFPEHFWVVRD